MTYEEAARRYVRALPGGAPIIMLPLAAVGFLGLFSRSMQFNSRIMHTVLNYPEEFRAQQAWDELGRPTTTIEDFAKRG
jgi:hypothetical protein